MIQAATNAANNNGIPPDLYRAVIGQSSQWQEHLPGPYGEYGLSQISPQAAMSLNIDPYDTTSNVNGGAKYLSQLYKQFGNWTDALRAYNTSPSIAASDATAGKAFATGVLGQLQNPPGTSATPVTSSNILDTIKNALSAINPIDPNSAINNVSSAYNPAYLVSKTFWDWVVGPGLKYIAGLTAMFALIWFGARSLLPESAQNIITKGAALAVA